MKYDLESLFSNFGEDIDEDYRQQFNDLVQEFEHVFSSSERDLGKCDVTSHKIDVYPGSRPVKIPDRRRPLHYKEDLQIKIDVFLDKELITPVTVHIALRICWFPRKMENFGSTLTTVT